MVEIIENEAGEPYFFLAAPDAVEEAFAEVQNDDLLVAFRREWKKRGLEPPRTTVKELRKRCLASYRERAQLTPGAIKKTLGEAAQALGVSERSLRHRIDAGELETTVLSDGTTALEFVAPPQRWHLMPRRLGPDPRILVLMVEKGVGPGESFEFGYRGSERTETYTRLASGANWKVRW